MKKILFLIGSLEGGGAEKVLVDTANSMDPEKYQITVQALFAGAVHKNKLSNKIRYKAIITCKNIWLRKAIGKVLFFVLGPRFTYNACIRDDYDYEIAFLEGLPTKVLAYSTNTKAKKYAWVHTDLIAHPGSYNAFGSERREGDAYRRFDKVFCVSKAVEEVFIRKYGYSGTPTSVVYNILDDREIQEASREKACLPTDIRPCFVSVGRLIEAKGYDRLLRIHKRLIDEGHIHSLLIIGDGDLRGELQRYIDENHLENTAFLLGYQENPHKYVARADLFVCSSYVEGFSTAISEAVICGTPVLGTDVSGNREPEEAPRCSVVVENNEQALYEAICKVLDELPVLDVFREEMASKRDFFQREKMACSFERIVLEKR